MTPRTRPNILWRLFVVLGVGTMTAVSVNDEAWERFRELTGDAVSRDQVRQLLVGTAVVHAGEAALAYGRARGAGVGRPSRWALATLLWGFPVLGRLRRAKRAAGGAELIELVDAVADELVAA